MSVDNRDTFLAAANMFQSWDTNADEMCVTAESSGCFVVSSQPWVQLSDTQATALRDWLSRRLSETAALKDAQDE